MKTRLIYLRERKEAVYDNLRDLNFEYKAGKFPDSDYQEMKASLEEEAAAILAEICAPRTGAAAAALLQSATGKERGFEILPQVCSIAFDHHPRRAHAAAETLTGTVKNGDHRQARRGR